MGFGLGLLPWLLGIRLPDPKPGWNRTAWGGLFLICWVSEMWFEAALRPTG